MIAISALLPIFGYATIFYLYFKKTVSVSIFFSISSIITILFIFGMFDFLQYATYLIFYGGIVLLLFTSILFKKKLLDAVVSVPFVMFTLMSIIYLYMMKDAQLFFWDEYSHWGQFIKEMSFTHRFYDASSVGTNLMYPPGISIWDYFLVMPMGYNEGTLYFAYFLILFSSTLMMYERLKWKEFYWIILIFVLQMVVFATYGHWFSSIYVDHVVGTFFTGLVLVYLVDKFETKELFLFIIPLITLVLLKEIGLYFGAVFLGLVFILKVFESKNIDNLNIISSIKRQKFNIFILAFLLISMILVLKVWEARQEASGLKKPAHSMTKLIKNIVTNKKAFKDEGLNDKYNDAFKDVILHQQLHKEKISLNYNEFSHAIMSKFNQKLKLSTVGSFLFFLLLLGIFFWLRTSRNERYKVIIIGGYLFFAGLFYLGILYLSMPLSFGTRAINMVSYIRYINMYMMPLLFIGFIMFLPLYYRSKNGMSKQFITTFVIMILFIFVTEPYMKPLYSQLENGARKNIENATKNILKVVPQGSKLFVVFPIKNNGSLNNIFKYTLIPTKATISSYNFEKKKSEEMMAIFLKYDYIWFSSINNELVNKNRNFLRKKGKKGIFVLYKIEKENSKISFKPIL